MGYSPTVHAAIAQLLLEPQASKLDKIAQRSPTTVSGKAWRHKAPFIYSLQVRRDSSVGRAHPW